MADLGGRSVLEHTWRRAAQATALDRLIIAAGDEQIASAARGFGAEVVQVYDDVPSGSDRIYRALRMLEGKGEAYEFIVNIQGDEPFLDPRTIELTVERLTGSHTADVATPITPIHSPQEVGDPSVVKAVIDKQGYALYFSRAPIPYGWDQGSLTPFRHIGLYAFRRPMLENFIHWPPSPLERSEKLEQLRLLYYGAKIATVEVESSGIAVDTREDMERAREWLMSTNVEMKC